MKICLQCDTRFDKSEWTCPLCGFKPKTIGGLQVHCPELSDSLSGFNPDHFSELYKVEDSNFWFRSRNILIQRTLKITANSPESLLEIGCGTGYVLRGIQSAIPNADLTGSEIFIEGLWFSRKRLPDVTLMQMDATRIPFVDEYQCVGAFDVLEHIADDTLVLSQIYQALKPSGFAVFTVPQHKFLWSEADISACHERRYSRGELERKCKNAGFQVVKSTSFVSLLLPLMFVSRRMKNNKRKNKSNPYELDVNAIMNELFFWVLLLEHLIIYAGISLPFGGSRLVVCVKSS